jgi:hypothetical protein
MTSTPLTITPLRRHDEHTSNYCTSEGVMVSGVIVMTASEV